MLFRPLLIVAAATTTASAFSPSSPIKSVKQNHHQQHHSGRQPITPLRLSNDNPAEWDDERRSNTFQALLRDLQIEGVPLLGCDANQVHTLNAGKYSSIILANILSFLLLSE